jgi:hypothetical protein
VSSTRPDSEPPGASKDDAQAASSTAGRSWLTPAHLGLGAGLISALAALITAILSVPWITGGNGTGADSTQRTTAEPATLTRLLLEDPLTTESALPGFRSERCSGRYEDAHLVIEVHDRFTFCGTDTSGFGEASVVSSARVEVDYRFTTLPDESYRTYGPGSIQLRCRGSAGDRVANGIYAWLAPTGWWGIDHFVRGDATALVERRTAAETTQRGEVRRFRLDCLELDDGALEVAVYVDDTKLGGTLVAAPPPPGDAGVAVNAFTAEPIEVAFSRFRVYGPDR